MIDLIAQQSPGCSLATRTIVPPPIGREHMDLLVIEDDPVIGKSLRKDLLEAGTWLRLGQGRRTGFGAGRRPAVRCHHSRPDAPRTAGHRSAQATAHRRHPHAGHRVDRAGFGRRARFRINAGADDYMVKPFALVELMARVEAVCRRRGGPAAGRDAGRLADARPGHAPRDPRGTRNRTHSHRIQPAGTADALCGAGGHPADAVRASLGNRLGGGDQRDRSPHQSPPRQTGQGLRPVRHSDRARPRLCAYEQAKAACFVRCASG